MKASMKPMDAAWFFIEKPDAPGHFGPLIILSQPADAKRDFVHDWVARWRGCRTYAPPFNYCLAKSRLPSWEVLEPEQIDLDYHFRHSALPAPGGERELGILISRLQSHRLDRQRPLWECHIIEGLENNRFAIYLKLHHGQFDGIGAVRLLARTFSPDPAVADQPPPWTVGMHSKKSGPKQGPEIDAAAVLGATSGVSKALISLARNAYGSHDSHLAGPFKGPSTIFNRRISAQRRFATQCYPLDRFKALAHAASVSINDVFLTIAGGGLRHYLLQLGALPDKSLVGQIPVNIRPAGDASIGNQLAFIYAYLRTDIADPRERLLSVHHSTAEAKAQQEALPSFALPIFGALLAGPSMAPIVLNMGGYFRPAANLIISNVPGPKQRLYCNSARVEQIYGPSVLFHGQGLNITMSSYADEANIGFTGCRTSLPSMQHLAVYTGNALEEIEAAYGLR